MGRSYLRLLFNDAQGANADGSRKFKGLAWLFLGVPYSKSLLYDDENIEYKKNFPDQYRSEYAQEVWDLMQLKKTHLYMCGLKGMEKGMEEALGPIAESKGLVWKELVKEWKKEHRWHVEVY